MSKENVRKIHEATMRILSSTGVKFHHPDAVKVLKKNGIRVEGNIAYFTEDDIMKWVKKAPAYTGFKGADPKYHAKIGGDLVLNAPAAGPTKIMEKDGTLRSAQIEDLVKMIKLYEQNDHYVINGGLPCQPENVPEEWSTLLLYYVAQRHSNKALWCGCGNYEQMEAVVQMCCARYGLTTEELKEDPHLFAIVNTNTPLQFDIRMTETLFTMLKYRQPVGITAASMAGTTAPITLAGTVALTNAEVIAVIALSQMYAPGAPVIYGTQSTNADMATCAIAIGSPEGALCYKYCAEMARFYGVPSRAGGALTDAKALNAQAGFESMLTYHACHQNGVNMVFQSAGIMESYLSASFEKMIVDFEIIDAVNRYDRDLEVNEETIPEALIHEIGPGGQYLLEDHTFEYCKKEPMLPNISVRGPKAEAEKVFDRNIEKWLNKMLDSYIQPEMDEAVVEAMHKIMLDKGIDISYIHMLDQF